MLANRSEANAERLAVALRTEGATARAVGLDALAAEIAAADLVVACTGAVGTVVGEDDVRRGLAGRDTDAAPLVVCDLGLPRDVDPRVAEIAGVTVVDLAALGERLRSASAGIAVEEARTVVAEEVRAYFAAQRTAEVTPTVTALRRRAAEVVDAELLRLDGRMPDLDERSRAEVAQTVRRVVDKLLHTPTVQVKRLAQSPGRRHLRRGAARAVRARPADARGAGGHRVEHPHRERRARRRGRPGAGRRHPGSRGRR